MLLNRRIFSTFTPKSLILGIVIVCAVFAFVFTGFGRIQFSSTIDPGSAAKVGDQNVSLQTFIRVMKDQERADQDPDAPPSQSGELDKRKARAQKVIDQLVEEEVPIDYVNKMGLKTHEREVATWIKTQSFFKDPKTQLFDKKAYKRFLTSGQMSELEFYTLARSAVSQAKFFEIMQMPLHEPSILAEQKVKMMEMEFDLEVADIRPSEDIINEKLKQEAVNFANDPKNLPQLEAAFNLDKKTKVAQPLARVKSILISYQGAERAPSTVTRTRDEAKAIAEDFVKKIAAGEKLEDLSQKLNDDAQAKKNKGDLGFVEGNSVDPMSYTAIQSLNEKQKLSPVVTTPFGFRIFEFVEAQKQTEQKFDDVKVELARKLLISKNRDSVIQQLEKDLGEALSKNDEVAVQKLFEDFKLSFVKVTEPFSLSKNFIPQVGSPDDMARSLFSLKKPGDRIPYIVNFGMKKGIVRLVSEPRHGKVGADTASPTLAEKAEKMSKRTSQDFSSAFITKTKKQLVEKYRRARDIKINPIIFE